MEKISSKQVRKNFSYSVLAQIIYIIVSIVTNLVLPKYIDELQFAYWQAYLLYVGYVGILHLGLLDGILLRYSQYDYDELNKKIIHSQFLFLTVLTVTAMITTICFGIGLSHSALSEVLPYVAVGMVSRNVFYYTSYSFQMTNRIREYGYLVVLSRVIFGAAIVCLVSFGINNYRYYVISDLMCEVISVAVCLKWNSNMYFGECSPWKESIREIILNISSGISLMFANWLSFLLTGLGRMFAERQWGIVVFGKISFAFSLIHMFLMFVTALSIVVFPSLKRIDTRRLPELYIIIRNILTPIFIVVLCLYYPCCILIGWWLPNYVDSLESLGIIFPIVIFSSKVGLLTNNYLKALRKERGILKINIISFMVSLILYFIFSFIVQSLYWLLISMVITIALNSILAEQSVARELQLKIKKEQFEEIAVAIAFILIVSKCEMLYGFILFITIALLYFYVNRYRIKQDLSILGK